MIRHREGLIAETENENLPGGEGDGSALILSVAKYYSPSGKAIQDSAVTPNVVVADADEEAAVPDEDENALPADQNKKAPPQQDDQLQKAIEVLKSHTS